MFDSLKKHDNEQVAHKVEETGFIHSKDEDVVAMQYRVQPHNPIPELSNEFAKYYLATHIETDQEFYAIVFERSFSPDYKMIKAIMDDKSQIFVTPFAASITRLSTSKIKYLILIVEKYDHKRNLENHIDSLASGDTKFITSKLLPFICNILQFCESNELNCGNINPQNILVTNDKFLLREPYIAYPHSMQYVPYLATELLDTDIAGRKTGSVAADIFAAGITFLFVYFKGLSFPEEIESFRIHRLDNGSFLTTLGKKRVSDDIKNYIKGCLHDNVHERWKLRNLLDWSSGKLTVAKNYTAPITSDIFAAVSFNGENYNHYRTLASALFRNWDVGVNFLSEERVLKWIQRGSGKSKIIDALDELTSGDVRTNPVKSFVDKDERLLKAIIILDAQGPFRMKNFSAHLSSFGNMIAYGYAKQKRFILDNIVKISLKCSWEEKAKYNAQEEMDYDMVVSLIDLTNFYSSMSIACGAERILYHLNPTLPCLSPIVYNEYITTLSQLLIYLDKIASSSLEKMVFDRHIIAFISNKISLKREDTNLLRDIPLAEENLSLYGLAIISLAIRHEPALELVNLASLLGNRVADFLDHSLHNVRTKKLLDDKIRNKVAESDIIGLLKIVASPRIYANDQSGYYKATIDVNSINNKIDALANNAEVQQFGTVFGQRITVLISYALFMIISLFMVL